MISPGRTILRSTSVDARIAYHDDDLEALLHKVGLLPRHQVVARDVDESRRAGVATFHHHVDLLRVDARQPAQYLL